MYYIHAENQDLDFLKSFIDAMPCLVSYWGEDNCCLLANKTYMSWYDWPHETAVGVHVKTLLGPQLYAQAEPHIRDAHAGKSVSFERTRIARDGSVRHMWVTYAPNRNELGAVVGVFVLATDISDLRRAEADLKLAASVYDNIQEGIVVTDADGVILSVNPALSEISGFSAKECVGNTMRLLKSDRHDSTFYADMWREFLTQGRWQGEIWNRRKSGEVFLQWLTITRIPGSAGAPVRYIGLFTDIANFQSHNENLAKLAFSDALTGLPNRILLNERLERLIARARREKRLLAVLFVDLDGFKDVNDCCGHKTGDDLLKIVAERLTTAVRQLDTVGRIGGDEFLVLLDNPASYEDIANVARRILSTVGEPIAIGEPETPKVFRIGTSIGISVFRNRGETPAELVRAADAAMYEAKKAGRNGFRFDPVSVKS